MHQLRVAEGRLWAIRVAMDALARCRLCPQLAQFGADNCAIAIVDRFYLLQAHSVAFAATGRLDDTSRDAGVNYSGLRVAAKHLDRRIEGIAHNARHVVIERAVFGLDER